MKKKKKKRILVAKEDTQPMPVAQNATVKIKYHGPKANKHLDLPVGIESYSDIECSVIFSASKGGCAEVPSQYVEALLESSEMFSYADDAARHAYASWLTDPSSASLPPDATRAAPSLETKPDPPKLSTPTTTPSPKKDVTLLTSFEELL